MAMLPELLAAAVKTKLTIVHQRRFHIHLFVIKGRRPLTHHISSITVNQ